MELNITEEHLDEIIAQIVREQIDEIHEGGIYCLIKGKVEETIRRMVEHELCEKFSEIVTEVVNDFLDNKPVEINNGWGDRRRYESYTDFFADRLRERCGKDYEVKRLVEKAVDNKVEAIWKQYKREILEEIIAKHAEGGE